MEVNKIPLSADNQEFSIALGDATYQMRIIWRDTFWALDLTGDNESIIINGIPLVTGVDLLEQYNYFDLGFALMVVCDVPGQDQPTKTDLGTFSNLYAITE